MHSVAIGIGAGGENWEQAPGAAIATRIVYPEDEWQGCLQLKPCRIEVLDVDVDSELIRPAVLATLPKLQGSFDQPKAGGFTLVLEPGIEVYTSEDGTAHWLVAHEHFTAPTFWGPFDNTTLRESGLLEIFKPRVRPKLAFGDDYDISQSLREIAQRGEPFLSTLFELAPLTDGNLAYGHVARNLRDRRPEIQAMGLGEEADKALGYFVAHEPPLQPDSDFLEVGVDSNPADAPTEGWGPENEGLEAAVLIPTKISLEQPVDVRLFVRNSGAIPIYLTVSKHGGFDVVSAKDPHGKVLPAFTEQNFTFVGPMFRTVTDPGVGSCYCWDGTILDKLKLLPGAIWELKPRLEFNAKRPVIIKPDEEGNFTIDLELNPLSDYPHFDEDRQWTAVLESEARIIQLQWELHSLNGQEYSQGKPHPKTWPARGGWAGVLSTAPVTVELVE